MNHAIWKAARFDANVVGRIRRMTDQNHHIEALMVGAKMLGMARTVKKLELLEQLKDWESPEEFPIPKWK